MTDAATPEPATARQVHDLASAARAIERIIRRDEPTSPDTREPAAPADRGDADEDDAADAVSDDAVHGPGVDDDEEEHDDGDREEPRYKVKVGGEETEVALKDLIKGYQRGADYTKKTMRLADERRALARERADLESERAAVALERQRYAEQLGGQIPALRQQLAHFAGIDWQRLSTENPALYAQARPLFDSLTRRLEQAEGDAVLLQQRERERQLNAVRAHQDYIAEQKRALIAKHPVMADPDKARQETAALTRYLIGAGYLQDELARLVDHRDFMLAHKAMLYDRLMVEKSKVKETLSALPRVQKPGTARGPRSGAAERRAALMRRLERSGRTEDAARVIEEML